MTPRSFFSRHTPRDEAALWAARLDAGELSAAQHAALHAWLQRAPAHRVLLSTYCQLSLDLKRLLPAATAHASECPVAPAPATPPRRWRTVAIAAGLAAALVFVLGHHTFPRRHDTPTAIATAPARRQSVTLEDGTRADLNAQTALRVDFRDRSRRVVRLDHGEALFTVAKNPERPFIVETPGGRIRVTGTVFNLRAGESGRLEVAVLEGSVEVAPLAATEPLHLVHGDQAILADGRLLVRRGRPEITADAAAWREGQIVFDELPLSEAVARFATYHGRALEVATEVGDLRLGGRYGLDDLDGFLAALTRVLPVRVERAGDGSVQIVRHEPTDD